MLAYEHEGTIHEGRVFGIAIPLTVEMVVIIMGTRTDDCVSSSLGDI